MSMTSSVEELKQAIADLTKIMNEAALKAHSCNDTEFLLSIKDNFTENEFFTLSFIQGLAPPEIGCPINNENICIQKTEMFPHLKHTFNPQLNVIVDMLDKVLKNTNRICKDIYPEDSNQRIQELEMKFQESGNKGKIINNLEKFLEKKKEITPRILPPFRFR